MRTQRTALGRLAGTLLAAVLVLSGCSAVAPIAGGSKAPETTKSAAPSIDTAAGIKYANALVKAFKSDPFVAHIEQVSTGAGEYKGTRYEVVVTMSADFAGPDLAFDMSAKTFGASLELGMRVVGKSVYVNQTGTWVKVKRSQLKTEIAETIEAVRFITDPHDLRYYGEERVGKKDLQHFRANRDLPYDSGAGFKGKYDTFDIWATKDGTPVRIEATFTASSKKAGTVTGKSVMDFTKFGAKIKIKVPKNK